MASLPVATTVANLPHPSQVVCPAAAALPHVTGPAARRLAQRVVVRAAVSSSPLDARVCGSTRRRSRA